MDAAYAFESLWHVPAPPERCWPMLERALSPGTSWWPGVTVPDAPRPLAPGEEMTLRVRSPLGYALRMRLRLTEIEPGIRLAAASTGDLDGRGSIDIRPVGADASLITIRWEVVTRPRWMNVTAGLLRPLFVAAHDRVMRDGERALRAALASEVRNAGNPGERAGPGIRPD